MRAILALAILLLAAPASAEPILLFQVHHVALPPIFAFGPPPTAMEYSFGMSKPGIGNEPGSGLLWEITVSALDVGNTYMAAAEQIAQLNSVIHEPSLRIATMIHNSDSSFSLSFANAVEGVARAGNNTLETNLYVPTLAGFGVTAIERSVDSFYVQEIDFGHNQAFHYGGEQTIRVYGEQIPEPTAFVLILVSLIHFFLSRRRGNIGRR